MASPGEIAQVIAVIGTIETTQLVLFGPLTLIIYDYVITFDREVRLFWTRKITAASVLFFTIRYTALLRAALAFALAAPNLSDESCNPLIKTTQFLANASFLPFAVFSSIRAHALTRSWIIATTVFVLSLAPLVINFVQYGQGVIGIVNPVVGCQTVLLKVTPEELIIFPIVSRAGLVLADLILVLVTWRTIAIGPVRPRFGQRAAGSVAGVMLWNGLVYFIVLSILNLLHLIFRVVLAFASGSYAPTQPLTFITAFTDPLTTVLVSRFLLDLQEASQQDMKLDSDDPLHFGVSLNGTPSFVRGGMDASPVLGAPRAEADSESERGSTQSNESSQKTLSAAEIGIDGALDRRKLGSIASSGSAGSRSGTSLVDDLLPV